MEVVFFDYDGTLVDSGVIRSRVYATIFRGFDVHVDLEETFTRFKDVKLHKIIGIISKEQGVMTVQTDAEHIYRAEVTRLFDIELEDIAGANELLVSINVPMCVVSSGPVSRMQYSLGEPNMPHYFPERPFGGCNIQHWKPNPVLMFHMAKAMDVNVENCILVDGSSASAQSGIDTGVEALYLCADPHSKPIVHPEVTTLTHLSQLPELWKACSWDITAQLLTLLSLTPLKLAYKDK